MERHLSGMCEGGIEMIQKLLFCPLCGKSATVEENIGRNEGEKAMFHAACNNYRCGLYSGLRPWRATKEEAIAAWNRRPDKWIPVSARLPEKDLLVLLYLQNQTQTNITTGKIYASADSRFDGEFCVGLDELSPCFLKRETVTHWQPLPEPPKEVERK